MITELVTVVIPQVTDQIFRAAALSLDPPLSLSFALRRRHYVCAAKGGTHLGRGTGERFRSPIKKSPPHSLWIHRFSVSFYSAPQA
jgi:hypothetical protein